SPSPARGRATGPNAWMSSAPIASTSSRFAPRPDVSLYLQVWSEAGDPLLFEVSSGHGWAPTAAYLSEELRESLLGRGFEVGGPAQNYRKQVVIDGELAIRALAREMLAIA